MKPCTICPPCNTSTTCCCSPSTLLCTEFVQLLCPSPLFPDFICHLRNCRLECNPMTRSRFSRGSNSCCLGIILHLPLDGKIPCKMPSITLLGSSLRHVFLLCISSRCAHTTLCQSDIGWYRLEKPHSFLHCSTSPLEEDLFSLQPWFPAQLTTHNKIKPL